MGTVSQEGQLANLPQQTQSMQSVFSKNLLWCVVPPSPALPAAPASLGVSYNCEALCVSYH